MFTFNGKTNEELFALLTEDEVKKIVEVLWDKPKENTDLWRIKKTDTEFQVCISKIEKDEDLHPDNSSIIILTDSLDLYQQGFNLRHTKYRVGNLFNTYKYMFELFTKKTESVLA